jgi:transcription antitermination factor NusG
VHTLPHREPGAETQLRMQGFETFMPRRLKTRRHARRLRRILAPLFPRYLFVRLDLDRDRWGSVNGTFGVARLVMEGERPQPVPRGVVESLTAATDDRGVLRFDESGRLKVGERVRVLAGPFADHLGRLQRLSDSGRVCLLLDIMGGRVPVVVPGDAVMPAA